MASQKISQLAEVTSVASADYFPVVRDLDTTNKRVSLSSLLRSVPLGTASSPSISFNGDPNTGIYSPGADQVAISTGGSGRLFIDGSGRVLVNSATARTNILATNTVGFQLEGNSFDTSNLVTIRNSADAGAANLILGKTRGTTVGSTTIVQSGDQLGVIRFTGSDGARFIAGATIQSHADGTMGTGVMPGYLAFSTTPSGSESPAERLRITSAGLVGVGTSAPSATLHVVGTGLFTGSTQFNNGIQLKAATQNYIYFDDALSFTRNGVGDRLTIDSSGRVGIGTSSPTSALEVNGTITIGTGGTQTYQAGVIGYTDANWGCLSRPPRAGAIGAYGFQSFAGDTRMVITDDGKVGIGTTSPGYPLDVQGESGGATLRIRGGSGGSSIVQFTDNAVSAQWGTIAATSSSIDVAHGSVVRFLTNSTERARIDSSGRLLVGTSTAISNGDAPNARLQVHTPNYYGADLAQYSADAFGSILYLEKSRSASVGSHAVVSNNDQLAAIRFAGSDGSAFKHAAFIEAYVDGTPGANDMPGRLVFSTTADGASSPTERMRISSTGAVTCSSTISDVAGNVRAIPQNAQTTAYTLVASDAGKHVDITTGGVTVPSGVFGVGDAVTIYNDSTSNQTITQGASVTLRQAGTANTGNRTLAQYGVATLLCVGTNTFVITGAGLS